MTFNGNASEAMKFYHSILGGELTMQTFGEAKMAGTPGERDLIVHAVLKNERLTFMASDAMPSRRAKFGDNVHMSISGHDSPGMTKIFNELAKGGASTCPLRNSSGGTPSASLPTSSAFTGWST